MTNLASRNLRLFFRQKGAVFFSLLGVFIILGLYVVFLGDVWADSFPGLTGMRATMDAWIVAGIVAVTPITTAMGAFGRMVEDREGKQLRDFAAAPLRRSQLAGGYVLSACTVSFLLSLAALVLGEIYLVACGGSLPSPLALLQVLGIVALSVCAASAMVFLLVSFFSSNAAFTTASTVMGTLIGFVTGIYLPIGSLPDAVQWVVKLFPLSHAGALLRQVLMADAMAVSFTGAPPEAVAEFQSMMGVNYTFGTQTATTATHVLVLVGTTVLFFALAVVNISRKKK